MAHWKLNLAYDGTHFHGWQVQPGLATVQGALADALFRITGERVLPQGSGRTDAGVHALGQVASFALEAPLPAANLQRALNRVLPSAIRILAAEPVDPTFHARHSAQRKTYEYRLFERRYAPPSLNEERTCSPFLAPFVWDCPWLLALEALQRAAEVFCGTHDFTSFAASQPDRATRESAAASPAENSNTENSNEGGAIQPVKTILDSGWERAGRDQLVYRVTGSGFLHHMVRNLVGTMVEVGRGSLALTDLLGILAARDRRAAGPTAPASGLFLLSVQYGPGDPVPAGAHPGEAEP